jgi:hypothetical protein
MLRREAFSGVVRHAIRSFAFTANVGRARVLLVGLHVPFAAIRAVPMRCCVQQQPARSSRMSPEHVTFRMLLAALPLNPDLSSRLPALTCLPGFVRVSGRSLFLHGKRRVCACRAWRSWSSSRVQSLSSSAGTQSGRCLLASWCERPYIARSHDCRISKDRALLPSAPLGLSASAIHMECSE